MRTALIDADVLAFQAAVVSEKATNWGDGLWTLHAYEEDAQGAFEGSVTKLIEATGADKAILAFSDKVNWRKAVLPTYKSNRAGSRQPLLRSHLAAWAQGQFDCYVRPTLEGDDVLGILATLKRKKGDEVVVCSIDKDFKTIPGFHYNFGKREFFEVSAGEADYWHLMQTLTGDTVDGYSGLPGVGPVAAEKLLAPFWRAEEFDAEGAWEAVVAAFDKKGLGEEEALTQARVARICRASDYDFTSKEVILWTP